MQSQIATVQGTRLTGLPTLRNHGEPIQIPQFFPSREDFPLGVMIYPDLGHFTTKAFWEALTPRMSFLTFCQDLPATQPLIFLYVFLLGALWLLQRHGRGGTFYFISHPTSPCLPRHFGEQTKRNDMCYHHFCSCLGKKKN